MAQFYLPAPGSQQLPLWTPLGHGEKQLLGVAGHVSIVIPFTYGELCHHATKPRKGFGEKKKAAWQPTSEPSLFERRRKEFVHLEYNQKRHTLMSNVDPRLINPCLLTLGCPRFEWGSTFGEEHPHMNEQGFINPGSAWVSFLVDSLETNRWRSLV